MMGPMRLFASTLWGLDAAEWEAIGVWATAAITLAALGFAAYQLRDVRQLRIEQARPTIYVDVTFRNIMIKLSVKNTGLTTARNVKVEFDEPLTSARFDLKWQHGRAFADGIPSMAPSRQLDFLFDMFPSRVEAGLPMEIRGTVSYDGPPGVKAKRYSERFVIDLDAHRESLMPDKSMHDLVERVADIQKEMKKWTGRGGGVYVQAADADRSDTKEWREQVITLADQRRQKDGIRAALTYIVREWRRRHGLRSF